jgi:hypothetical protein
MAQQTINIGTNPNDGTGDPLRTAFDKTNDNFTELYNENAIGFPYTGSAQITSSEDMSGAVLGVTGSIEVFGDIYAQNIQCNQLQAPFSSDTRIELNDDSIEYFIDDQSMMRQNNVNGNGLIEFNRNQQNIDFVVLGDVSDDLLYVDASENRVGIKTETPSYDLDVNGTIRATNYIGNLPSSPPSTTGQFYTVDSSTLGGVQGYKVVVVV